jgi:hypothetical protein
MSFCQKAGSTPCRPGPTLESCAPSSSERRYAAHTASDTYPAGERESVCARFVLRRRGVRVRCVPSGGRDAGGGAGERYVRAGTVVRNPPRSRL